MVGDFLSIVFLLPHIYPLFKLNMAHLNMKSYVHGGSEVPLLFDTIGERLRLAAKMVIFEKENGN